MLKCVYTVLISLFLVPFAFATVSISSPSAGASLQSPVHFVASASTSCAKGVASMGVYTAPSVLTYVVKGSKLDTSLTLNPGTHNVTVQEWDNCGGGSHAALTVHVVKANVTVSSPSDGATSASPVHYVASATSGCAQGVAAMGIYTAPNKLAFRVKGASLNTSVNLSPGTYHTVVQEWDNCGGAATQPVTITVKNQASSGVQVSAPANNSTVSAPVHYAASASATCAKGVAAMGIYRDNNLLAFSSKGNTLDTSLTLAAGQHHTVVQEWDNCGGSAKAAVNVTVSGAAGKAKTFYGIQKSNAWQSYGELPPIYGICSNCSPAVVWSSEQKVSSPSLSGASMATHIAGNTVYADAIWVNHLIGNFSSQGLADANQTLVPTLHNFTYAVDFFAKDVEVSQALEFDINQFVNGKSLIFGHECRLAGGHEWDIWNNKAHKWVSTGIPCNPVSNRWNHVVIKVQRTEDNRLLYQSITLNGQTSVVNHYDDPTATSWNGLTINYQLDGNHKQEPYTVWIDNLNFTYY
jgi:hypothetical protein